MSRRIRQGGGGWGTPLKKRYAAGTAFLCRSRALFAKQKSIFWVRNYPMPAEQLRVRRSVLGLQSQEKAGFARWTSGKLMLHSRAFSGYDPGNTQAQDVCDHLSSGRRKNDVNGETAPVRRCRPIGRLGDSPQASTRLDLGLDGIGEEARNLHQFHGASV